MGALLSFEYRAIDPVGKILSGSMEAETPADVVAHLERLGCTPISAQAAPTRSTGQRTWRDLLKPEPSPVGITAMTLDLAMLLRGGVALDEALLILAQLASDRWLAQVLRDLHASLGQGQSFSQALARHPRMFSPIYVKMVEAAEASGSLAVSLTALVTERQRGERLRKRFISAISYPVFLVVAALGVLVFVLIYLIPKFEVALQGFRDRIDPTALIVFNMSAFLNRNLDSLVIALALLLVTGVVIARLGREHGLWIALLARLPGAHGVLQSEFTVTFCRTLAVLVRNGVDISSALRLMRGVVRMPRAGAEIDGIVAGVRQGRRLSDTLGNRQLFPRHVVQMLRVGEEAGELAASAEQVALFYETKLDAALGRLISVVGPAVMIFVSILIAWLIISVMTALMSINDMLA
ncbi:type II secretion system F family protein [Methylobacterium sp. HMF5984]|uniref:type II secretion system F family protein n=1 Tax=Methylobacterium sp. HMF5984 TaxID=3367370 RepID=UPI0038531486